MLSRVLFVALLLVGGDVALAARRSGGRMGGRSRSVARAGSFRAAQTRPRSSTGTTTAAHGTAAGAAAAPSAVHHYHHSGGGPFSGLGKRDASDRMT